LEWKEMQAILLTAAGPVDHFEERSLPLPVPLSDEVRIRIRAAGFNPMDVQKRRAATASQLPMLLGGEVAGEIDAVGASVSSFIVGDPVMTCLVRRPGGYAEFVWCPGDLRGPEASVLVVRASGGTAGCWTHGISGGRARRRAAG
jgi:NADPH:quinone reductase-like Zn-dependent oxidoreductase